MYLSETFLKQSALLIVVFIKCQDVQETKHLSPITVNAETFSDDVIHIPMKINSYAPFSA